MTTTPAQVAEFIETRRRMPKTVRNILANELGLSRENVIAIIEARVDKLLSTQPVETIIAKATERALDRLVKGPSSGWNTISIRTLVQAECAAQLRDRVSISVALKD